MHQCRRAARVATMIRAADLPTDLIHAFVDALEAWTLVEHDHFMLFQFLDRRATDDALWQEFTEMNPRQQRKALTKLVAERVADEGDREHMRALIERISRLAIKRNRIVHGRWHRIELMRGNHPAGYKFLRLYEGRELGVSRPTTADQEQTMRGCSRFYTDDLRQVEAEMRDLARDLHRAIERLIPYVAPRLR